MSAKFTLPSGTIISVSMTQDYDKPAKWHGKEDRQHIHSRVTIIAKGGRTSFDYWGSHSDYCAGVDNNPKDALYCWASDAISGANDFEDFCGELGYDEDSRSAYSAWKACKRYFLAAERLGISQDDTDHLANDD